MNNSYVSVVELPAFDSAPSRTHRTRYDFVSIDLFECHVTYGGSAYATIAYTTLPGGITPATGPHPQVWTWYADGKGSARLVSVAWAGNGHGDAHAPKNAPLVKWARARVLSAIRESAREVTT